MSEVAWHQAQEDSINFAGRYGCNCISWIYTLRYIARDLAKEDVFNTCIIEKIHKERHYDAFDFSSSYHLCRYPKLHYTIPTRSS